MSTDVKARTLMLADATGPLTTVEPTDLLQLVPTSDTEPALLTRVQAVAAGGKCTVSALPAPFVAGVINITVLKDTGIPEYCNEATQTCETNVCLLPAVEEPAASGQRTTRLTAVDDAQRTVMVAKTAGVAAGDYMSISATSPVLQVLSVTLGTTTALLELSGSGNLPVAWALAATVTCSPMPTGSLEER